MNSGQPRENSAFAAYHPLVSFVYFAGVITVAMFSMHPAFLIISCAGGFLCALALFGRAFLRTALFFCLPVLLLTALINPLLNHRGATTLFFLNGNPVTGEAALYGLAAGTLLVSAVAWFRCFSGVVTADKLMYLFGRVLPVLSLVLSMCLRYIPLLKNRFREIGEGQMCMGRRFSARRPLRKMRQTARELSILIAWSLESSIDTADSMEARGYGLRGRTSFHLFRFSRRDGAALLWIGALLLITAAGCLKGVNNIYYYPGVYFPHSAPEVLPAALAYGLLAALPTVTDVRGEVRWKRSRSGI